MQALPVLLVFLSATLHAFVQVLLKKSSDKIAFSYLQILAGTIILFPVFLAFFSISEFRADMVWLIVLNGILETFYLFLIAKAYTLEDISIVYPLARSTPVFALIFSIFFLNETLSAISIFGVFLTIIGIYLLPLEKFSLVGAKKYFSIVKDRPGAKIAILAALVVASYSFFAKISLEYFNPIVFSYLFGIPILVFLTPYVLTRKKQELRTEWEKNKKQIVLYAILIFTSFVLLLWALQLDTLAEIISLRQISIVIGVLFGWQILNERRLLTRLIGAAIIAIGAIIISIF